MKNIDVEDAFPLSPLQEGILFHSIQGGHSGLYVEQMTCRITGPLELVSFKRAWQQVVARHAALRTAFIWEQLKSPIQAVGRAANVPFEYLDWTAQPPNKQEQRLRQLLMTDRQVGFDLNQAPLMRLRLVQMAPGLYEFIWTYHHLVLDGWALPIVLKDVFSFYWSLKAGQEPNLPKPAPFRDYIAWLQRQDIAAAQTYWRTKLAGCRPLEHFGVDHPHAYPAQQESEQERVLPARLNDRLKAFCRGCQVTPNSLLQAAWALLLSRYTRNDDVLFGAITSGRAPEIDSVEDIVGMFINTLPARISVQPEYQVLSWIKKVQAEQVEMRQYEYSPLIRIQAWSSIPANIPLFESILVVENYPTDNLVQSQARGAELKIENVRSLMRSNYPLNIVISVAAELRLRVSFDPNRFTAEVIGRLMGHFESLLGQMIDRPDAVLGDLELLTPSERQGHIDGIKGGRSNSNAERNLVSEFLAQVGLCPDAVAIVSGNEKWTFQKLHHRSAILAQRLRSRGVTTESRVGISATRSPELVAAMIAILKCGGVYVPLDPVYPADRLGFMIQDAGVHLVLVDREGEEVITNAVPGIACELLSNLDHDTTGLDGPPSLISRDNLAYVMYTSGSTGQPKGIMIPHGAVLDLVCDTNYIRIKGGDRLAQMANASFDAATFEIWGALLNGATLVLLQKHSILSGEALAEEIQGYEITSLFLTTALFNRIAQSCPGAFAGVRDVLFGGEMVDPRCVLAILNGDKPKRLLHVYGPTEVTTFSTWHSVVSPPVDGATVPIGKPVAGTSMYVLDDHGHICAADVTGELYLGGDRLARGYLNDPAMTAERFVPDPFGMPGQRLYRTGDLCRCNDRAELEFVGRVDHQIKLRGFRIELGEIENVLAGNPFVRHVAILLRGGSSSEKILAAYVVLADAHKSDAVDLRGYLKGKLPDYMIPSVFVTLANLPLTPNGKVDREALLREPLPVEVSLSNHPPVTELEKTIAEVWKSVLKVGDIGRDQNFFDLGGHSLLLLELHGKLKARLSKQLSIIDLFQHPTVAELAAYLSAPAESLLLRRVKERSARQAQPERDAVAIIGVSGSFPGAAGIDQFWDNLKAGIESITFFSEDELKAAGIDPAVSARETYVRAKGVLEAADHFDADFFGCNPREAECMDPQQRVFLEHAWQALENAAYAPEKFDGLTGVFAGLSQNTYLLNLLFNPALNSARSQVFMGNQNEFLPTRVSYKLNLKGPSINIQTACSTSLVAVHFACRSLLNNEIDLALAGGVSISVPLIAGYEYEPDGIGSPDGHCRTFDAQAAGTVAGNGVAVVVLKRLSDAVRDRDTIIAVVKGSAVNNDGHEKIGYTAPSVDGQAEVICQAQIEAGVTADDISYVETHGTGTALGDPVEIAALTKAFRATTRRTQFCEIGSLKTNVGHTDAAAGVAGLVKTALMLQHRTLVPSLHFEKPNPKINFTETPFSVCTRCAEWKSTGAVRRAGVSSFGIGGTNAHVILEEPGVRQPSESRRTHQLLTLSARTPRALQASAENLATFLSAHPTVSLLDTAFSLQMGRAEFGCRRSVVAANLEEAIASLKNEADSGESPIAGKPFITFMFPGQGALQANNGRDLYHSFKVFREQLDVGLEILRDELKMDLRPYLFPSGETAIAQDSLEQTLISQPLLFAWEYALAQQWLALGIEPAAMIGHSLGEYVAACLAGVFLFEDAIRLVARRARLLQALPLGEMVAVASSHSDAANLLHQLRLDQAVAIAAINTPGSCVLSGGPDAMAIVRNALHDRKIASQRLPVSIAFHSPAVNAARDQFVLEVRKVSLRPPVIPYVSNLTGTWITPAEAVDPEYYGRHLRQTVLFSDGITELMKSQGRILLEIGPGQTLAPQVRKQSENSVKVLSSSPHRAARTPELAQFLEVTGQLWRAGQSIKWSCLYENESAGRIPLPTYPFERRRFWIDPPAADVPDTQVTDKRPANVNRWFYGLNWTRLDRPPVIAIKPADFVMVFTARHELSDRLVQDLASATRLILIRPGRSFRRISDVSFEMNYAESADYQQLLSAVGELPDQIIHLGALDGATESSVELFESAQEKGFFSLAFLGQALAQRQIANGLRLDVVTSGIHMIVGGESLHPERATVLGAYLAIPQELPGVSCRLFDFAFPIDPLRREKQYNLLIKDLQSVSEHRLTSYRNGLAWVPKFEPSVPEPALGASRPMLRPNGVYLITGGYGNIGCSLAEWLLTRFAAKVVLMGRSDFPDVSTLEPLLEPPSTLSATHRKAQKLKQALNAGGEILVLRGDVADTNRLAQIWDIAEQRFGKIDGVIHAAGIAVPGLLANFDRASAAEQFKAKVWGTYAIAELTKRRPIDFCVAISSLASVLGGLGLMNYAAANSFMDAFVEQQNEAGAVPWFSLNLDAWQFGEDAETVNGERLLSMNSTEGISVFNNFFERPQAHRVIISIGDLRERMRRWVQPSGEARDAQSPDTARSYQRPATAPPPTPPETDVQRGIARIWQQLLGIDQVGIHDHFFELRGDSLLATQMMSRLRDQYSIPFQLKDLFASPTIAELAILVEEKLRERIDTMSEEEVDQLIKNLE